MDPAIPRDKAKAAKVGQSFPRFTPAGYVGNENARHVL